MEYITTVRSLGAGVFGKVELVRDGRDQKLYALKTMDKKAKGFKTIHAQSEISAGEKLKGHKNICELANHWEDENKVYMALEYIQGTDLITFMANRNFVAVTEEKARNLMVQLIAALVFCHSKGVAHRDVKLDNIMLDTAGNLKLIDFGLCKAQDGASCKEEVGSIEYVAPEVIKKKGYNGFQSDVYSAGVVLFALLCGEFPFPVVKIKGHRDGLVPLTLVVPKDKVVSRDARNLLEKLLQSDPAKRLSMKDIKSHPWFNALATASSADS